MQKWPVSCSCCVLQRKIQPRTRHITALITGEELLSRFSAKPKCVSNIETSSKGARGITSDNVGETLGKLCLQLFSY